MFDPQPGVPYHPTGRLRRNAVVRDAIMEDDLEELGEASHHRGAGFGFVNSSSESAVRKAMAMAKGEELMDANLIWHEVEEQLEKAHSGMTAVDDDETSDETGNKSSSETQPQPKFLMRATMRRMSSAGITLDPTTSEPSVKHDDAVGTEIPSSVETPVTPESSAAKQKAKFDKVVSFTESLQSNASSNFFDTVKYADQFNRCFGQGYSTDTQMPKSPVDRIKQMYTNHSNWESVNHGLRGDTMVAGHGQVALSLSKRRGKLSSSMDAGNWVLPPAQMARLTQSMLSTSVVLNTLKLGGRLSLRPRSIGIGRTANANEPEKPPVLRAELSLDNLNLDDFQHREDASVITELCTALKCNKHMTSLSVADNHFTPIEAAILLQSIRAHPKLSELDLADNKIGPMGAHAAANLFHTQHVHPKKQRLTSMSLFNCDIGDRGAAHLASAISSGSVLETLSIGCNRITRVGMDRIMESMRTNYTLKTLNVAWNTCATLACFRSVCAMLQDNDTLESLNISNMHLGGEEAALLLTGAMENNTMLQDLNVSTSGLGGVGLIQLLVYAMERNRSETPDASGIECMDQAHAFLRDADAAYKARRLGQLEEERSRQKKKKKPKKASGGDNSKKGSKKKVEEEEEPLPPIIVPDISDSARDIAATFSPPLDLIALKHALMRPEGIARRPGVLTNLSFSRLSRVSREEAAIVAGLTRACDNYAPGLRFSGLEFDGGGAPMPE